jgi:hypothetical protein
MLSQELILSIFHLCAHLIPILKDKIREAQVVVWFLVGEVFELIEKLEIIIIHNNHPPLTSHIFNYVVGHFWPRMREYFSLNDIFVFFRFFIWVKKLLLGIDRILSFLLI